MARTTKAEALWHGNLKEGSGTMKLPYSGYEGPFTYASRFGSGEGSNPEELLGAAHAGCFSMFLASILAKDGHAPRRIHTTASVHMGEGAIDRIDLVTEGEVEGIDEAAFQSYAEKAKAGCPVSKALAAVGTVTVEARLAS